MSPTTAYVGNYVVDEPYRGQGIGKSLQGRQNMFKSGADIREDSTQ